MHASRPYCPPATTTGPEEQHGLLPVHIYAHFNCIIILIKRVYLRKKVVARLNSAITNSVNDSATIITAIDQSTHALWPGCLLCLQIALWKDRGDDDNICDPYWIYTHENGDLHWDQIQKRS